MLKSKLLLLSGLSILSISVSCKKTCKELREDTYSGVIKEDISVYPSSGYMTSSMGGNYLITANDDFADRFEISFDQGQTKVPVDYSKYSIVACPVVTYCNARFDKSVEINYAAGAVVYSITSEECGDCGQGRTTENYVVIPAVPESYKLLLDVKQENID